MENISVKILRTFHISYPGYYVHVETRECETQKAELAFLGKFWDVARAEQAANMLQALLNAATW